MSSQGLAGSLQALEGVRAAAAAILSLQSPWSTRSCPEQTGQTANRQVRTGPMELLAKDVRTSKEKG